MRIKLSILTKRVGQLLAAPQRTFQAVRAEDEPGRELAIRFACLMALIPAGAGFLGGLLFGAGLWPSLIANALLLPLWAGSVFGLGFLTHALAPSFGTVRNENRAYLLAAYSSTPVWVLGVGCLFPRLVLLVALAGFGYAACLFYMGCQILLETPREKAFNFAGALVGGWFALVVLATLLVSRIVTLLFVPL